MADSPILPGPQAWRLVQRPGGGSPDLPPEFFKFFRELVGYIRQIQGNTDDLTAIEGRLDALEASESAVIVGQYSVRTLVQDAQTLVRLVGDVPTPSGTHFYGTNAEGARGWYQRLLSTLADVDLTGLADGDGLVWDATAEKFTPAPSLVNPMTTEGDLIVGDAGGVPIRLPVGADGEVLSVVAGVPTWGPGTGGARGIHITGGSMSGPTIDPAEQIGAISPSNYVLTGNWLLWCYPSGSIELDVRKAAFGSTPGPGDSICGGNFPEVAAGTSASGDFTGWTTSISQGEALTVSVTSSTVSWFVLLLESA